MSELHETKSKDTDCKTKQKFCCSVVNFVIQVLSKCNEAADTEVKVVVVDDLICDEEEKKTKTGHFFINN